MNTYVYTIVSLIGGVAGLGGGGGKGVGGDWRHYVDFPPFCTRGTTFVISCLDSNTLESFYKRGLL